MVAFVTRRLLFAVGTVLAASVISFLLVHASPGSPGAVVAGVGASKAQIAAENHALGWDRPLAAQFWTWFSDAVRGNLGTSLINGQNIKADLFNRLPVTASIALYATLLSGVAGVLLGVTAAVRGGRLDRAISLASGVGLSLPTFWVGIAAVYLISIRAHLLPATGFVAFDVSPAGYVKTLALPVLALAVAGSAIIARTARTGMVTARRQEHIRTLQAIGTPPWRIRYIHALRFASVPVVSVLGVQFIALFGSSIIIEQLFTMPGLGQATQLAIGSHDFPAIQGVVVIATVVVVLVNLVLDLAVAALDPKLRAGNTA